MWDLFWLKTNTKTLQTEQNYLTLFPPSGKVSNHLFVSRFCSCKKCIYYLKAKQQQMDIAKFVVMRQLDMFQLSNL